MMNIIPPNNWHLVFGTYEEYLKYCNCGNKLISDEEKRIKVCKECK